MWYAAMSIEAATATMAFIGPLRLLMRRNARGDGVLLPHGGPRGLDERRLEPGCALADPGRAALAGALVAPRTEAGPRNEVACGRKPRHVDADLADDDVCRRLADAGHRRQQLGALAKGSEGLPHARLHIAHGRVERVDLSEVQLEEEAMVLADGSAQRLDELGPSRLEVATGGQLDEPVGIRLARHERLEQRPPSGPKEAADHAGELDVCVLEGLL